MYIHSFCSVCSSTLPRPSTLAHVVDVQQFIRSHIARTIYTALPLLLDFPKRRRANRKVNILEMPSARFIGERVVGAASFINKVFFLQWHVRNMIGSYGEKRKPLHYIHSQDGPAYTVACWGCSLHTLSHKTTVATSLTSRRITSAWGRGGCLV